MSIVTRHIVGYKKEESEALLKFLYDHIAFGVDFQARVKWDEKTVVVWDVRNHRSFALPLLTTLESCDWPLSNLGLEYRSTPTPCTDHATGGGALRDPL